MNNQRPDRQISAEEEKRLKEKHIREYKQERRKIWMKFIPIVCVAAIVVVFAVVVLSQGKDDSDNSNGTFNGSTYSTKTAILSCPRAMITSPKMPLAVGRLPRMRMSCSLRATARCPKPTR